MEVYSLSVEVLKVFLLKVLKNALNVFFLHFVVDLLVAEEADGAGGVGVEAEDGRMRVFDDACRAQIRAVATCKERESDWFGCE